MFGSKRSWLALLCSLAVYLIPVVGPHAAFTVGEIIAQQFRDFKSPGWAFQRPRNRGGLAGRGVRIVLLVLEAPRSAAPGRPDRSCALAYGFQTDACGYPVGALCESTMARMSRFSKTRLRRSPVSRTATSTMARPKSSARIAWLGNSTRNAG